jgi:hypothetical protein
MILFGAGNAILKPVAGNESANPTPMVLAVLQDFQIEISRSMKTLYGQNQSPVAVAAAEHKYTAKAKFANFFGKQWCDYVFGQTTSTTIKLASLNEVHPVPATPYQITIAPPGSGTFFEDLGVVNGVTGVPLVRVASSPVTGQYSVNEATGVYTFAAADTGINEYISYLYTGGTGVTGISMTVANQPMGYGPIFEVNQVITYNNQSAIVRLFNCVCSKISLPSKNTDFVVPDFEIEAFANAAGNVMEIDFSQ